MVQLVTLNELLPAVFQTARSLDNPPSERSSRVRVCSGHGQSAIEVSLENLLGDSPLLCWRTTDTGRKLSLEHLFMECRNSCFNRLHRVNVETLCLDHLAANRALFRRVDGVKRRMRNSGRVWSVAAVNECNAFYLSSKFFQSDFFVK